MHSFNSVLVHCVWSTKNREPILATDLRDRLWPYLGGIARENKMKALAIGGAADHVHMLISLPPTLSIAKTVQLLKGNSSKWIHETFPKMRAFQWQEGYGAFSIGVSGVDATISYIRNQTKHHRTRTFREEFIAMLRRHGLDYDKRIPALKRWAIFLTSLPGLALVYMVYPAF
jgi:REP element-mobilizing transposase RayT